MRARDWRSQAKQRTPRPRSSSSTPDCELRAMIKREQEPKSPFVFTSERGAPLTRVGFARMVERLGEAAKPWPPD